MGRLVCPPHSCWYWWLLLRMGLYLGTFSIPGHCGGRWMITVTSPQNKRNVIESRHCRDLHRRHDLCRAGGLCVAASQASKSESLRRNFVNHHSSMRDHHAEACLGTDTDSTRLGLTATLSGCSDGKQRYIYGYEGSQAVPARTSGKGNLERR
jgi:hypothetical protein